jgi:hypothetical protein
MFNNVIAVVKYVIAARPSPLNFMIADIYTASRLRSARRDTSSAKAETG